MPSHPSRRTFLQSAAVAAAGVTIVPRHVLGGTGFQAPSDTFNIAGVGVGGMGRSNLTALGTQNIVALCDVDWSFVDRRFGEVPAAIDQAKQRLAQATDDVQRGRLPLDVEPGRTFAGFGFTTGATSPLWERSMPLVPSASAVCA